MRKIDEKFSTNGTIIFNTVSGEHIPEDEPLFLLRARDVNALPTLREYLSLCQRNCNLLHIDGIKQAISKFDFYSKTHLERMKEPGKTKHLKLEGETNESL